MANFFWNFKVIRFPLYSSSSHKLQENKRMTDRLNKASDGVDVAVLLEKAHSYSTIQSSEFQL
jgi:hypothetical protein